MKKSGNPRFESLTTLHNKSIDQTVSHIEISDFYNIIMI